MRPRPQRRTQRRRPLRVPLPVLLAACSVLIAPAALADGVLTPRCPNTDLEALSQGELSLGLRQDPFAPLMLPRYDEVLAEHAIAFRGDGCGVPIRHRLPSGTTFTSPIDLAMAGRAPLEFCPDFWPEHDRAATFSEMCEDEYLGYWPLQQAGRTNPFAVARFQVDKLNNDHYAALRRFALAVTHWVLNGRTEEAAVSTVLGALAGDDQLANAIAAELGTDMLLQLAPDSLWQIVPDESAAAVDLRVSSSLSYDTSVSMSRMLRLAAGRNIDAVVVADHGHIGGAQDAARIATHLKAQGHLPQDFTVLQGEHIHCLGGSVTAIGITRRVPEGMTFEQTIREVHNQGGVVILNHPGALGGLDLLRMLDVDGYFLQPNLFELFRTLNLLYNPELAGKPALYGSQTRRAQGVGLPYSSVVTGGSKTPDAIVEAIRTNDAYGASNLYFPLMGVMIIKPVATFEKALNSYFVSHEWLTGHARALLQADHVIMTTTWDDSVRELMSIDSTPGAIRDIFRGTSPLREPPRVSAIAAEYGKIHIEYRRDTDEVWVQSRFSF